VVLDANTGNLPGTTYLWTNGDTTRTVTLNSPAFISVTNTDQNGCHSTAQAIVADNRPLASLTPDITICQNNNTPVLDAQNPGATYAWKINGINAGTIQTQAVDTTVPGTFIYSVVVTDPVTTCSVTVQKTFTIEVSPSFNLTGTNPSGCNIADGTIQISLLASVPTAGPYAYFLTGPNGFNQQGIDQTAPSTQGPFGGQKAGIFSAVVTDEVSGCTISHSFGLTDAPFAASATAQAPNCDPVTVRIQITAGAPVFPIQYNATDNATGQATTGSSASAPFNMTPLPAGTYTIAITDSNLPAGCTFVINNFVVNPNPPVNVAVTPNLCSSPPTITASGATSYAWTSSPANQISGSTTGATIQLIPGSGTVTFTVVASTAGQCDNTQSVTLDVNAAIVPSFTQSDPCASQVLLTASPVGNYIYRWYLKVGAGLTPTGLVGQQTIVNTSGSYAVELTDPVSGCAVTSTPAQPVTVNGVLTATLTATPACDDGKPFTLTAVSNTPGVTYAWLLNNNTIAGATQATLDQTTAGNFQVDVTKGPCTTSAKIQVIKSPIPIGKLPDRWVICDDPENKDPSTAQVDLDPGLFASYRWFKNQLTLGDTTQVYTADKAGVYSVDLTNSFGCTATDETDVRNECVPKIVAPTAFRPGSNVNANKEFRVFSFFITDNFQIFLYNRWGELVFQSGDRNFRWNGNFNNVGQPLPGGTYAYVIKYVSSFEPDKGVQEKHGGVVLLR
jgi:gliding motility-associated-like protein